MRSTGPLLHKKPGLSGRSVENLNGGEERIQPGLDDRHLLGRSTDCSMKSRVWPVAYKQLCNNLRDWSWDPVLLVFWLRCPKWTNNIALKTKMTELQANVKIREKSVAKNKLSQRGQGRENRTQTRSVVLAKMCFSYGCGGHFLPAQASTFIYNNL